MQTRYKFITADVAVKFLLYKLIVKAIDLHNEINKRFLQHRTDAAAVFKYFNGQTNCASFEFDV